MTTTITEQLRANVRDRYNEANSKNEQLQLTLEQDHRNITDTINKYAWDPCLRKNILNVMFGLYLIESNDLTSNNSSCCIIITFTHKIRSN